MIGYLEVEYLIYDSHSLKEKRAVLKRTMTRLKQRLNVSVAEIDHQDVWQRTKLAVVTAASSRKAAERELENALHFLDSFPEWERLATSYEWL
ncbi:DUF503 domain-containing protein [Bacillus xiapuensis]|uniref:DUF503 domain-containing protein n=1 Tax=Bacillus xiapuensis TaxID=2014075 RepID=UPI000C244B53|nr:DUF503 family protein [Bacillus xiapuensis]